ncbi:MAG TPA: hypothetical protein VFS08_05075 [Gemmatimonadaceae bacterium]|nr:hypothetical protein [Gemmatimonadaceae bacterium]
MVAAAKVNVPLALVGVAVSGIPATPFPWASTTRSTIGAGSGTPAAPLGGGSVTTTIPVAVPAVAIAENVIGGRSPTLAVTVCAPDCVPRVKVVRAWPSLFVTALAGETVPPPVATAKATFTPPTGWPAPFRTSTTSGVESVVPTVAC